MARAEKLKEYMETHPRPGGLVPSTSSASGENQAADGDDESDGAKVTGRKRKMIRLANRKSAVLCNIIAKKLREERARVEWNEKKVKEE